jgi:hypothetical protein
MGSWIENAKLALDGQRGAAVEVVGRRRPPVFDSDGMQAATAPLAAACAWLGAFFREFVVGHPLDVWALLLRLIGLALTIRVILLGRVLYLRIRGWLNTESYGLALTPEGLLLRTPSGDKALLREQIVSIQECSRQNRRGGRRWRDVYLVTRPETGSPYVVVPPFFDAVSSVLAARLTRWLGPVTPRASAGFPDTDQPANTLFQQVNAGQRPDDVLVVPLGRAWLKRGPYASVLLGFAVLDGFIRFRPLTGTTITPTVPWAVAICLIAVPLVWLTMVRRQLGPLTRAALLMTPSALLISIGARIDQIRWSHFLRAEIVTKTVWSMLEGMYESRSIVFYDDQGFTVTVNEAYLGIPAEVIVAAAEAYQQQILPN